MLKYSAVSHSNTHQLEAHRSHNHTAISFILAVITIPVSITSLYSGIALFQFRVAGRLVFLLIVKAGMLQYVTAEAAYLILSHWTIGIAVTDFGYG